MVAVADTISSRGNGEAAALAAAAVGVTERAASNISSSSKETSSSRYQRDRVWGLVVVLPLKQSTGRNGQKQQQPH